MSGKSERRRYGKISLHTGVLPGNPLHSLQPVLYEKEGEGEYRRVRMACNGSCASCGRMESCDYLESAPERIGPEKEWQLRDTLMTGTKER